ncbi:rhodanese-like domain-containing protein [Haloferula sargassicola]|uniref:Thiosulfate sulfurtransferase GlpE n=1 Tax=Haloferula sargassicola TaxID=490096 RepID=A0ABP9UNG9_9BACT
MKLATLLVSPFLLVACSVPANGPVVEKVSTSVAQQQVNEGAQLLDVRTKAEWDEGHLEDAVRLDVKEPGFAEKTAAALDESKPVVVYCRSGHRSAQAASILAEEGFTTVYDMRGGITSWTADGKPVTKD